MSKKISESKEKALKIAEFVSAKKAKDTVILDVSKVSSLCDYFVICSGDSDRQVEAIYKDTVKKCRKEKIRVQHCESDESLRWVLVDFFDVMLHVFHEEARGFYNLEYLWGEAKKISFKNK